MVAVIEDAGSRVQDWSAHGLTVTARWAVEPGRDEVRDALRTIPDDGVLVSGSTATLNAVVDGLRRSAALDTPVAFLPAVPPRGASGHVVNATLDFAEQFALPADVDEALAAAPVALPLARNDIGGVLLAQCQFERPRLARFGAQTYHDDALISDGAIRGLSVIPQYGDEPGLRAIVTPASGRKRTSTSYGRAVQIACDAVEMYVDGRSFGEVEGRTWYVDDREHWLLRGALVEPPAQRPERTPFWRRLRR